jgi:chromosome segregation ATPase
MARTGVTEKQVAQAADELVLAGERPTIERVRASLGTGSPNTLIRHLDAWWKQLGERLTETRRQINLPDAPPEVSNAASTFWRLAVTKAAESASAEFDQQRAALDEERLTLDKSKSGAELVLKKANADVAEARVAAEKAELRAMGLDQLREHQQARIDALEGDLERARQQLTLLIAEQQASAAQIQELRRTARADRDTAAEHVKSVENRAHQEIDRARGEAAKAAKRIAELDKQVQRQAEESARRVDALVRDLRKAESESAALKLSVATKKPAKAPKRTGTVADKGRDVHGGLKSRR